MSSLNPGKPHALGFGGQLGQVFQPLPIFLYLLHTQFHQGLHFGFSGARIGSKKKKKKLLFSLFFCFNLIFLEVVWFHLTENGRGLVKKEV